MDKKLPNTAYSQILQESGDEGLAIATGLKKAREYFEEYPEAQGDDQ